MPGVLSVRDRCQRKAEVQKQFMKCEDIRTDMSYYDRVRDLQLTAFPPEERFTMEKILSLAESDHIEYKSFWEGEQLCGILFYNVGETMLYLFYLAVPDEVRSHGYGAKLLHWLREFYPDKVVVGNIEPTGIGADNEEQRIRRFVFYERNGFGKVPYRLSDDSGLYDIISSGSTFDKDEYMRLIDELGFGDYHPVLLPLEKE